MEKIRVSSRINIRLWNKFFLQILVLIMCLKNTLKYSNSVTLLIVKCARCIKITFFLLKDIEILELHVYLENSNFFKHVSKN